MRFEAILTREVHRHRTPTMSGYQQGYGQGHGQGQGGYDQGYGNDAYYQDDQYYDAHGQNRGGQQGDGYYDESCVPR